MPGSNQLACICRRSARCNLFIPSELTRCGTCISTSCGTGCSPGLPWWSPFRAGVSRTNASYSVRRPPQGKGGAFDAHRIAGGFCGRAQRGHRLMSLQQDTATQMAAVSMAIYESQAANDYFNVSTACSAARRPEVAHQPCWPPDMTSTS